MRMELDDLAGALGARIVGPGGAVDGLAIDSRLLRPGQLFAAVTGERDGHDFVGAAVSAGAGAVLVERADAEILGGSSALVVPSVADALAGLARWCRERLDSRVAGRVVGITGSVGKTTAKDLLASVLRQRFVTAASEKSFNNELGVPLTLANAPDDVEALVVEMGARGVGHVGFLCDLARPSVGVVTLVAASHSESMGGLDQIAVAKRELVESLPGDGLAVLNADDPRVAAMASHTPARVLTFGRTGEVRAEDVRLDDELRAEFRLRTPDASIEVHLGVRGEHNVTNALAAAAAAWALGVDAPATAAGLAEPELSPWRMELTRTATGAVLLNDAYNANPASMIAALHSLAAVDASRRVAVLGYMAELADSAEEHRRVRETAEQLGVEVVAIDTDLYGVEPVTGIDAAAAVIGALGPGDAVLVKASRVVGLERLVAAIS